jgi:hypothetical protein
VLNGDYLYMVNDMTSTARCFEAKTGRNRAGALGRVIPQGFSAAGVTVGDKVFLTNDEGETYVIAAGPAFKLLGVNKLKAKTLASPALVDGRWYWRTDKHLLCVGKK